jgi:hypothetical protein
MNIEENDDELLQQFLAELRAAELSRPPVLLTLPLSEAFMLLAQLQLALRHPLNHGSGSKWARHVAKHLQKLLSVSPAMSAIAERGWHE